MHAPEILSVQQSRRRRRGRERLLAVVAHTVLLAGAVTMLIPLLWMLSTSLKQPGAVFSYPPQWLPTEQVTATVKGQELKVFMAEYRGQKVEVGLVGYVKDGARVVVLDARRPDYGQTIELPVRVVTDGRPRPALVPRRTLAIRWRNYPEAWSKIDVDVKLLGVLPIGNAFTLFYLNSLYVAVLVTLGQVLTSSLAAYAFARLRFLGRDTLFLGYLGTMMIPGVVTMIPVFILLKNLGLIDTYTALIVPAMFSAYGTFLLRQFFLSIPPELEDAARMDGCGNLGVWWNVIMPLSKPALATLTTFTFLGNWNSFMWPLIVINSIEKKTLPVGLETFRGLHQTEWTLLMAASMIAVIPALFVFILNQRFFVRGILLGSVKG